MNASPIAGRPYSNTYREFQTMFPDEESCTRFLACLRWPDGFRCSVCSTASHPWTESRNRLECPACRHQTYITAGTIFEKTRTPLTTWFDAAWHVTTAKIGISAKTLERTLGTSYRTAWMMLQRFRVAMVNSERTQLSNLVELDEIKIGGVNEGGKRGRGSDKRIVVIALELKEPRGFGRLRIRHVPDASSRSLLPFVSDVVTKGATVHTDGWSAYAGLEKLGYRHDVTVLSSSDDPANSLCRGSIESLVLLDVGFWGLTKAL